MKRISLVALLVLLVPCFSYAQKISNRLDDGNVSILTTEYSWKSSFFASHDVGVALRSTTEHSTNITVYHLIFGITSLRTPPLFCQKGSRLLIKTFQNEVLQLVEEIEINSNYGYSTFYRGETKYQKFESVYMIGEDDLKKVIASGIKKMRFETNMGFLDLDFKNDELGQFVKNEFELISTKKDINAGF